LLCKYFDTRFACKVSFSSVFSPTIIHVKATSEILLSLYSLKHRYDSSVIPLEISYINDVAHISEWDIISLPLALVWSGISQKSHLTSLCLSNNSALPSPIRSSNLISLMKCAASVWVAFNLMLWKGLQWKEAERWFAVVHLSTWYTERRATSNMTLCPNVSYT
jgi:hypothetical protein